MRGQACGEADNKQTCEHIPGPLHGERADSGSQVPDAGRGAVYEKLGEPAEAGVGGGPRGRGHPGIPGTLCGTGTNTRPHRAARAKALRLGTLWAREASPCIRLPLTKHLLQPDPQTEET